MFLTKVPNSKDYFVIFFLYNHREHEGEIDVDLKRLIYHQRRSLHNLLMKCYFRGTLNDLRVTTFFQKEFELRSAV